MLLFWVSVFGLGGAFIIMGTTLSRVSDVRATILSSRAFYTAEAGAQEAVYQFALDNSYSGESAVVTLNGISADASVNASLTAGRKLIRATAQTGGILRKVTADAEISGAPTLPPAIPLLPRQVLATVVWNQE